MTRHGRPHQPGPPQDPGEAAVAVPAEDQEAAPPAGAVDPDVREPGGGRSAAGRIRVNDGSKVSPLTDEDDLEEVPSAGGRFSAWRRHRQERSAARVLTASRLPADHDPVPAADEPVRHGSTAVGAADGATVVVFPGSPAGRRRRRRLWAGLGVLAALAGLAAVLFLSPLLAVREVAVRGAQLTDPARVEQALESYEGVPLTRISKAEVRERVGRIPQVRSIEVLLEPPHLLVVELHERVPVAAVEDGGEHVVVDSEGVRLRTASSPEDAGVPVVTGGPEVLEGERFEAIAAVLAALPESVLAQLRTASAESLSSVELEFADGRRVVWGTAEDSELKAQVLRRLVEARGADSGIATYDVSSPTRPVVR
ncbi:cell division protein FtsQ/DivIB [Kocuria sp. M1R5S2]|uniref:cell division protein FtsQ/DivIB n=1 Tax=Kocuria rhizosphaerae TaxID=3376285 RepID=UPI00379C082A